MSLPSIDSLTFSSFNANASISSFEVSLGIFNFALTLPLTCTTFQPLNLQVKIHHKLAMVDK